MNTLYWAAITTWLQKWIVLVVKIQVGSRQLFSLAAETERKIEVVSRDELDGLASSLSNS
jgi:hypothetical protein